MSTELPLFHAHGDVEIDAFSSRFVFTLIAVLVGPPAIAFILFARHMSYRPSRHHTALLLVLGDVGRSPRMMYHASSLAKHGWETYLVGYNDTPLIPSLLESPHVTIYPVMDPPKIVLKMPWIFRAPIRIIYQILSVLRIAFYTLPTHPEIIIVQNPPSIPTLALAQVIATLCKSRLIIDWHNTGCSILGLRVGEKSVLVRIAKWFEASYGREAYAHLFVTRALEGYLAKEWKLQGRTAVLHDRPPTNFRRTEYMVQHELFTRLTPDFLPPFPPHFIYPEDTNATTFTLHNGKSGMPGPHPSRPALMVSSTSWTADEDFSLLLKALDSYQAAINGGKELPKLIVLITGKGALRKSFEKAVAAREASTWKDVVVRCTFVSARDYPVLLGSADLGVSLHTSSSGRDLPMKVVDMFGCGVPVLAKRFGCIGELVKDGKNGLIFDTAEELAQQMMSTFTGFPNAPQLELLRGHFGPRSTRSGASTPTRRRDHDGTTELEDEWTTWDENWDRVIYRGILDWRRRSRGE